MGCGCGCGGEREGEGITLWNISECSQVTFLVLKEDYITSNCLINTTFRPSQATSGTINSNMSDIFHDSEQIRMYIRTYLQYMYG